MLWGGNILRLNRQCPAPPQIEKKLNAKLEELEDRIYHHYDSLSESLANGQRGGVLPAEPMEQTLETSAKPDEGGLKEQDQTKTGGRLGRRSRKAKTFPIRIRSST